MISHFHIFSSLDYRYVMVKYSNRGLSNDPSNLWLFGVLYWILYLSLEVWTQSILLGKFFLVERDYLTFSKQAIRYFIDISPGLQVGRDEQIFDLWSTRTFMLQMNSYKCVDKQSDLCRHKQRGGRLDLPLESEWYDFVIF